MKLIELLKNSPDIRIEGNRHRLVAGLSYDSRRIGKNYLFICLPGNRHDGHRFWKQAYQKGARVILTEKKLYSDDDGSPVPDCTFLYTKDSLSAMSKLASIFYGQPSEKLKLTGITGTNGKTTVSYMLEAVFENAGFRTGRIGTINHRVGSEIFPASNTTPLSLDTMKLLKKMVDSKVEYVFMEVSSHGLKLHRVDDCRFRCGVFTNLTPEHLDFHRTMEDYYSAKKKLFDIMVAGGSGDCFAVINLDDCYGKKLAGDLENRKTYLFTLEAHTSGPGSNIIRADRVRSVEEGTIFRLCFKKKEYDFRMRLHGIFNVRNALAAIGVSLGFGLEMPEIADGISKLGCIPGRFEVFNSPAGYRVVVDYAHTPSGLENVLDAIKSLSPARVITVFGCGGDRDTAKRPVMGKIAAGSSDYLIITDDNPRTEDPEKIVSDIETGIKSSPGRITGYRVIRDRFEAISEAIAMARPRDVVLIAGKGHEDYQIFADRTVHFDDREVVKKILGN